MRILLLYVYFVICVLFFSLTSTKVIRQLSLVFFLFQYISTVFVLDNGADNDHNTTIMIIAIAVGASVGLLCITVLLIVIAVLIYRYKVKHRYEKFHEFQKDYNYVSYLNSTGGGVV